MKTMTCNQLGGACEEKFTAETFDEVGQLSKQHSMAMFQAQDAAHLKAKEAMQGLMQDPAEMQKWFESKRQEFEALPED